MRPPDPRADRPATGASRRSLVRAAGHAVWAAPVISAASAAPALAASPSYGSLVVTGATYFVSGKPGAWQYHPYVEVLNQGSRPAGPLTLTLTFPTSVVGPHLGWSGTPGPAWGALPSAHSTSSGDQVISYQTTATYPGLPARREEYFGEPQGAQASFYFVFDQLHDADDAVSVLVSAPSFTSGTALLDDGS